MNKEVVERLKKLLSKMEIENKKDIKTLDESAFDNTIKNALKQNEEALTEAIRCVELVPELIERLKISVDYHQNGFGNFHINEHVENCNKLLKKAKEMIE